MIRLRWSAPAAVVVSLVLLASCSSSKSDNPTPQITGLFPSEITAGSQAFTLFISGANFISTSTAQWNGSNRPSTYNSASTQLAVSITAADVQNPGVGQITVTSPAPGGGTSLAMSFTINAAHSGGPTITGISPSSAAVGSAAFTLSVTGTNFAPGDYVTWNGGLRTTMVTSATQISAQILATDLAQQVVAGVAVHTSQLGVASPSVSFQVGTVPSSSARFPQVISVGASGGPADGASSSPAMSADGRYVAFYSEAKNLVGGASGNVFARDTCVRATNCAPRTIAVDVARDASSPNAPASSADGVAISADGRYVAFTSWATNLVSDVPSGARVRSVFVRDLCAGTSAPSDCVPRTELVSINSNGEPVQAHSAALSADGRFVVFTSAAEKGAASQRAFVRDTCNGAAADAACTPRTVVASVNGENEIALAAGAQPTISADGRYVVFAGSPLDAQDAKSKSAVQIFVRDTCLGVGAKDACTASTASASVSPDGAFGNADSQTASVSGDGRFVVFQSGASNLAGTPAGKQEIFLRNTCAGATAPFGCVPSTSRISPENLLPATIVGNYSPAISASGRYVTYLVQTEADDPYATAQGLGYVVVYDTCFGATGACSPHLAQLTSLDPAANQVALSAEIHIPVPLTNDGKLAAFFTNQAAPATPLSGLGDVLLTTTPFSAHRP